MKKSQILSILFVLASCGTGVAEIKDSYIRRNAGISSIKEDFCRAVRSQGMECWENEEGGLHFSGEFGENIRFKVDGMLFGEEGTPIYKIRPVFRSNNMVGEKGAQERFWDKIMETLGSYGYGSSDAPSFLEARKAYVAQQAAEAERAEIEKKKQDASKSKALVALSSPRSCQSLKSSYLKCVKAATDQKWKSNTMIWNDFKQTEMMIPGSACGLICTVEVMESCVRVGFAKFPKDFLDPETCASVCSKCWFN